MGRDVIGKWIQKRIEQRFDEKLESLKSELRTKEQSFAADLREKELEINALRSGALSELTNRNIALHARRVLAVERLWTTLGPLKSFETLVAILSVMNFEKAAKSAKNDVQQQAAFEKLFRPFKIENITFGDARNRDHFFQQLFGHTTQLMH